MLSHAVFVISCYTVSCHALVLCLSVMPCHFPAKASNYPVYGNCRGCSTISCPSELRRLRTSDWKKIIEIFMQRSQLDAPLPWVLVLSGSFHAGKHSAVLIGRIPSAKTAKLQRMKEWRTTTCTVTKIQYFIYFTSRTDTICSQKSLQCKSPLHKLLIVAAKVEWFMRSDGVAVNVYDHNLVHFLLRNDIVQRSGIADHSWTHPGRIVDPQEVTRFDSHGRKIYGVDSDWCRRQLYLRSQCVLQSTTLLGPHAKKRGVLLHAAEVLDPFQPTATQKPVAQHQIRTTVTQTRHAGWWSANRRGTKWIVPRAWKSETRKTWTKVVRSNTPLKTTTQCTRNCKNL